MSDITIRNISPQPAEAPRWAPNTAYVLNMYVTDPDPSSFNQWKVTTAGTSSANNPSFPSSPTPGVTTHANGPDTLVFTSENGGSPIATNTTVEFDLVGTSVAPAPNAILVFTVEAGLQAVLSADPLGGNPIIYPGFVATTSNVTNGTHFEINRLPGWAGTFLVIIQADSLDPTSYADPYYAEIAYTLTSVPAVGPVVQNIQPAGGTILNRNDAVSFQITDSTARLTFCAPVLVFEGVPFATCPGIFQTVLDTDGLTYIGQAQFLPNFAAASRASYDAGSNTWTITLIQAGGFAGTALDILPQSADSQGFYNVGTL